MICLKSSLKNREQPTTVVPTVPSLRPPPSSCLKWSYPLPRFSASHCFQLESSATTLTKKREVPNTREKRSEGFWRQWKKREEILCLPPLPPLSVNSLALSPRRISIRPTSLSVYSCHASTQPASPSSRPLRHCPRPSTLVAFLALPSLTMNRHWHQQRGGCGGWTSRWSGRCCWIRG